MFIGMLMLFCLFTGLALIFGANFMKGRDLLRAKLMIAGALLSMVPLVVIVVSFFYPVFD
jgi:hypothetical protein